MTRAHFTVRGLLAAAVAALLALSLPADAHAKKRRGGAKVQRRIDKGPAGREAISEATGGRRRRRRSSVRDGRRAGGGKLR